MRQSIVVAAACLSCQAYAQVVLEEVIVVAQKRVETVQEVPLTVNVVDGGTMGQFAINNVTDMANAVPGLVLEPAPQGLSQPKIRGLGTGTANEELDQSVGLFIDGVWSGKPRDLQSALFDVDRIEVIKGTQTSQLGKNTSLGAILVMSNRPENENGGYISAEYDLELDSTILAGVANLATDYGNYRLAVNIVSEEGYVANQLAGGEEPARDQNSLRLSGSWDLGERAGLYASYTWDEREVTGMQFEVSGDPQGWYREVTGDPDVRLNGKRKTRSTYSRSGNDFDDQESHRAVVEFTYDISSSTELVSLTGYSQYDNDPRFYDSDFSALDFLEQYKESSFEQFSQEFRIHSRAFDDRLDYVAGLFYLDNTFENYQETVAVGSPDFLPILPPVYAATGPIDSYSEYEQNVDSWSIYGNGAIQLADRWRLTLGIRYTDESREFKDWVVDYAVDESFFYVGIDPENGVFVGPIFAPGFPDTLFELLSPPHPAVTLKRDEDNVDGSFNLQYDFSDAGNVYASWARGSKSGGYTTALTPEDSEFDTEVAETIEIGFKSEPMGGAMRLNGALFYTEIDDFQSVRFVGDGFLTETIPVEAQGLEFDSMWAASENLVLALSATYADAENTATGDTPTGAPEWSASFTLAHTWDMNSAYQLRTNAAVNYTGDRYTQSNETYEAPAITLVDLRVALAPMNDLWEVALMARNLFDEQEMEFGFDMPIYGEAYGTSIGSLNRPRTVSIQARYNF